MEYLVNEIDNWLKENANGIFTALNEPANEEQLNKLNSLTDEQLPVDVLCWFKIHNGINDKAFANLIYGLSFYSIDKLISRHGNNALSDQVMRYCDDGIKEKFNQSTKKIVIADDNSSCSLCIDLDPDDNGSYGQVVLFDDTYQVALLMADSLNELFKMFFDDLIDGNYTLLSEALEDGVHWLEGVGELDIINWYQYPKWSHVLK